MDNLTSRPCTTNQVVRALFDRMCPDRVPAVEIQLRQARERENTESTIPNDSHTAAVTTANSSDGDNPHASFREDPMNEFTNMGEILLLSYPHLFWNGTGVLPKCGPLTIEHSRFLLLQYDWRFAEDMTFLFHLGNVKQRSEAVRASNVAVNEEHVNSGLFAQLCSQHGFRTTLEDAVLHPNAPEHKKMKDQVTKCLSIVGSSVKWTEAERRSALAKLLSMIQAYGTPGIFLTVSPADMDSMLLMQWTGSFGNPGPDNSKIHILPSLAERRRLLAKYPVLAAEV